MERLNSILRIAGFCAVLFATRYVRETLFPTSQIRPDMKYSLSERMKRLNANQPHLNYSFYRRLSPSMSNLQDPPRTLVDQLRERSKLDERDQKPQLGSSTLDTRSN